MSVVLERAAAVDGEAAAETVSASRSRHPLFVERATAELVRLGVPAERIEVAPGSALGTYSEAGLLRRHAESRGFRSVLFVTSAYHSRRAWWSLRRAFDGSAVEIGIDAVAPGEQTPPARSWWLTPRGWREVTSEYAKIVYYHAHY
ncbi:MAG: YdcF family protein [Acidobacteria bacterium]|nr:YdcF family protein [Acidobacteriota bacterium]